MKKKFRIKKNEEFQEVFQKGQSFANRQFVVYVLDKKDQGYYRLGLSVSKKIGNAVMRNQIKRYVRQSFLELHDYIHDNKDYIIIARNPASQLSCKEVKKSLIHVLKRANALKSFPRNEK